VGGCRCWRGSVGVGAAPLALALARVDADLVVDNVAV